MNKNCCIIRNTFNDRSVFLQISLEYQESAELCEDFETYIFIDRHPKNGYNKEYEENPIINKYKKIVFDSHKGRKSLYLAIDYIFSNFDYDYVIAIEDDVIISKDYLKICNQLILDNFLEKNGNLLYFHIGAWEKPKGDLNKIIESVASSRSILINRTKFDAIKEYVYLNNTSFNKGNDYVIKQILQDKKMVTAAPEYNRHGHFGVYGWSSSGELDYDDRASVFKDKELEEIYKILKDNCLNKEGLLKLNSNKNLSYFWDFDPATDFSKLIYPKLC